MADLSLVFDLLARDRASSEVAKVGASMDDAGKEAGGLGDKIGGMFDAAKGAALGAGLAVGAAFFGAIDQQTENTKLTAQLGLTPEGSAAAGKLAGQLYAQNYGDSLGDVNDAIKAVAQNMAVDVGDADMSKITGKVLDLSSAFGVDAVDSTKALGNLIETGLAPDASAALDIVTAGFQMGNDAAGDWLDTLNEYAPQFAKVGVSGQAAVGLISQGMQAGARDSDLVADAIKEFSIRAVDGSDTTAQGFQSIGLNAGKMAEAIGHGGKGANDALEQVFTHLRAIKDPVKQAQAATALFGTQAEDLGKALFALDPATAAAAGGADAIKGSSDRLDATLSSGLGPRLEELKRGAQQAAVGGMSALINGFTQGKTDAGGWQGGLQNLAATVSGVLSPAFSAVSSFVTGTLGPALSGVFGFLSDHQTTVTVVAGVIAALLVPAIISWGVESAISGVKSAGAWIASTAQSSWGAVKQAANIVATVAKWVWMGASAVAQGVVIAAVWTAQIVASAVTGAAGFAVQVAKVVAGWVVQGATAVAQGAVIAAVWVAQVVASAVTGAISFGIQVATVVGGWVLMGAQALLQAARMAAAWFIALGPVGWIIAAVIGLVALIVSNWDTVVSWTTSAWTAVTGAVSAAWDWIKGIVSGAFAWVIGVVQGAIGWIVATFWGLVGIVKGAWNAVVDAVRVAMGWFGGIVRDGIGAVVDFFTSLPGKIVGVFKGAGTWLLNTGKDMINGLLDGAGSLLKNIGKFFLDLVPGWIKGPLESALGIGSPSRVFADYGVSIGQGLVNGVRSMRPAVADELANLADTSALASLNTTAGGGGLGYTPPGYDMPPGGAALGGGGATYVTTVSGVASPEQVAAQVAAAQRTNEFLAGATP